MTTAGNPWGWFLGYLILGVTGSQASGGGNHIINGEDCIPHSQPWQAAPVPEGAKGWGGGVPGSNFSSASVSYTIGLGLHSLEASQEPGSVMMEANFSIQHPEYNKPFIANDLMLIKLEESVPGSDAIQNISIASQCPTAGDSCLVSGWGQLMNGRQPQVPQCVNISVVPEEICSAFYASVFHPSMFCAGGGQDRKDSCRGRDGGQGKEGRGRGDSGGPLVCNGSLQGLVSFGQVQCGQPYVPSVYTNLCKFTDWIQKTIQDN
uniref:Kallikrein related peptidase 4 n=1 Tax=Panthera tigris altaica TaxID=74533 RepID=A0A8C9KD11_PANTA